ncbi:NfeD family protein [Vibrio salinus]|uniref:NfeD family protein n=1 Tax=Vibrio salinus TaxID=2899784 RepID=UPI001E28DEC3|nr:nodulation protein NfeD [Vibrio salinus]MCE0494834.1 nodulation protein NfeD [Vibrio salinus]
MYRWIIGIVLGCLIVITDLPAADTMKPDNVLPRTVPVLNISGAIGPAVGDYVINEIRYFNNQPNTPAIIITLDTPGGLVSSLRKINQQILASEIPVLCLVYPQGARAASAGTYILYACNIAAMAPATTLGAATPVQIGGTTGEQKQEKESDNKSPSAMEKKVLNDSIAYIRSLAQLRGRNAEWAEKAVREAATLSANEALENNVINLIADSPEAMLKSLHNKSIIMNDKSHRMDFNNVTLKTAPPDWRNQFLTTITNPNIAYILMMIGIYGLILEFYSPSFGIAGITGAIALLVALYAFQLLPVNYVGLGLILVGIALLAAEAMIPSFGLLGIGGIIAFTLGSVFLMDTDLPELKISMNLIYSIAVMSGAFILFVLKTLWRIRHKKIVSGIEALIGSEAQVDDSFSVQGFVLIRGERWAATCDRPLHKGDMVIIDAVNGLTLHVRKRTGSEGK